MLFWIVAIAAGVLLGLVAFATIESWLPAFLFLVAILVQIALALAAAQLFGLRLAGMLWAIGLFDLGCVGLWLWTVTMDRRAATAKRRKQAKMTPSERTISARLETVGLTPSDLGVDRDLAWAKFWSPKRQKHVLVQASYGISSTDETVAEELIRLAHAEGF